MAYDLLDFVADPDTSGFDGDWDVARYGLASIISDAIQAELRERGQP
jgi:hypothetical protein